jgi:class 3 adenylate cyclase
MAIDVCGYSALSERDERKAIEVVKRVSEILDRNTRAYNGRRFHQAGDGFLIEFQTASDNLNAALVITEEIRSASELQALEPTVCRIGLHAGEVTEQEDGDLLGHGVNIAARLQGEADEGGILASSNFMNLVSRDFTGRRRRRGFLALKNISEPVEAFDIESATNQWGRIYRRGRTFLRRNSLVLGLFVIAMAAIAFVSLTPNSDIPIALEDRVDTVLERGLEGVDGYGIDPVDSAYMRGVLRRLANSGKPSDKASFAMLEAGNIDGAIAVLTDAMVDVSPQDPEYIPNLHQIGALAMNHDVERAAAVFETILLKDPDDANAMVYLGLSNVGEARSEALWLRALETGQLSEERALEVKIKLAFNDLLRGDHEIALQEMIAIEDDVKRINKPYLLESFHSDRGMIYERLDRLVEAEADLLFAVDLQKRYGYDYNTERAFNVLGFIALKRSERGAVRDTDRYLAQAEQYFRLQYEAASRIAKKRGQAESLYFIGDVELQRGNLDGAERDFLQAFTIAREGEFYVYEFLVRIGFAQLAKARGDQALACSHLSDAMLTLDELAAGHIGPQTRAKIDSLGCKE